MTVDHLFQMSTSSLQSVRGFAFPFVLISYGTVLVSSISLAFAEVISLQAWRRMRFAVALTTTLVALFFAAWQWLRGFEFSYGIFEVDRFSLLFALILLGMTALTISLVRASGDKSYSLLLLSAIGGLATIHAVNLVGIYLGLELASLPLVAWMGQGIQSRRAQEVRAKFYLSSAFASLLLLAGVVLTYAASGHSSIDVVMALTAGEGAHPMRDVGLILFVAGIAARMAWVPFHFSLPDVIQGGQTATVSYYAVLTKLLGALVLIRLVSSGASVAWAHLFGVAAILSAVIGGLQALQQSNLRRRLAFHAISDGGFLLLGFMAASGAVMYQREALTAICFFLLGFSVMFTGALAVVTAISRRGDEHWELSEYAGLGRRQPALAAAFSFFLLGLAGFPLTVGFMTKFTILTAVFAAGHELWAIAVIGVWILSIASAVEVVAAFYFKDARHRHQAPSGYPALSVIIVCFLLTLSWGLMPGRILLVIRESVQTLLF